MKTRNLIKSALILVFLTALTSCQKVVHIDLNAAGPQIVIEGNISNQSGPYEVSLTKTVNFDQDNIFPNVSNASVVIYDNAGIYDTLHETSPGVYSSPPRQGIAGRTYTLEVTSEGKKYVANCYMPQPVNIDSLAIAYRADGFFGSKLRKVVNVYFTDPAGIVNYYRIVEIINGTMVNTRSVVQDQYRDGESFMRTIDNGIDTLRTGDTVTILLESIDSDVFNYFRELNRAGGAGGGLGMSASPANPTSNFDNNALGYFNAYSVTSKKIIIP